MSLITKYAWRDAGTFFETPQENAGSEAPAAETETDDFDKERAMATIKNLRGFEKQAKALQQQLDAIKAAEDERKQQELSEAQKATQRAEKAEAERQALAERHRNALIRSEIKVLAAKAGFVDPEDAVLNLANDPAIDLDDHDNVTGADAAVKALAKAKPHLLASTKPAPLNINATGGGNPPPVTVDAVVEQKRHSGRYVPF